MWRIQETSKYIWFLKFFCLSLKKKQKNNRMITKENGLKYAKLVHVSVDNGLTHQSNKVYIMEEQNDGRIKCEYGRVGKKLDCRLQGFS